MIGLILAIAFVVLGGQGDVAFKKYTRASIAADANSLGGTPNVLLLTSPLIFTQRSSFLIAGPIPGGSTEWVSKIRDEMSIYPMSLLTWTNLKLVFICQSLYLGDLIAIEHYQAVSIPTQAALLIGIRGPIEKIRASIHHELFHFIDYRCGLLLRDIEWAGLNNPDFQYGAPLSNDLRTHPSGFVSHYATSKVSEDKAETFVMMITEPEVIEKMILNDRVIYTKVKCMRTRLVTICPELNEDFWMRILAKRIDQLRKEQADLAKREIQGRSEENRVGPSMLLFAWMVAQFLLLVVVHFRKVGASSCQHHGRMMPR